MITEREIEQKDFSAALPSIIGKLNIVYELIDDDTGGDELLTFLDIIQDAMRDLKIINNTLNESMDPSEPSTEPISAEEG